ncbi:Hint domain-containing protein [uncultured Tateyamaria sp.]|uniref:Hint domain-containing protein n=1 Tax=uncultured Tateyamaria sp. TaxID=455651 RepID=UPI002603A4FF|nr:Hint domain-containing protein [uncultured Tateyamaria sp.]
MATYEGTAHLYFDGVLFGANVDPGEAISDNTVDTTFSVGEAVFDNAGNLFSDGQGTFVGTLNINGTEYPIFSADNSGATINNGEVYVVTPAGFDSDTLPGNLNFAQASHLTECFLTGTRIATPDGEKAVEELAIGDEILTADGTTVPVRWVGWQKVVCAFQPPERLMPVRVQAGALGNGLPKRDLTLTGDHALHIDGMLINASALVNDSTITWVPLSEFDGSYTVYHVETENHDLILAEGTATETYIDYLGRSNFHNYAEFVELYGDVRTIPEMNLPRVSAARLVPPAIRARLAEHQAA